VFTNSVLPTAAIRVDAKNAHRRSDIVASSALCPFKGGLNTYTWAEGLWPNACSVEAGVQFIASAIRKSACVLVCVLWALTLGVAQQVPPQGPQSATITGTVLDITGSTVPNAIVVLQEPNQHRSIVTRNDGFFEFGDVNLGTPVRVVVSAFELKNWTSSEIILQPGQSFILTDVILAVAPVDTSVNAATPEEVAA